MASCGFQAYQSIIGCFVLPEVRIRCPALRCHTYLLTYYSTEPGYPTNYRIAYPGHELPDNGRPTKLQHYLSRTGHK